MEGPKDAIAAHFNASQSNPRAKPEITSDSIGTSSQILDGTKLSQLVPEDLASIGLTRPAENFASTTRSTSSLSNTGVNGSENLQKAIVNIARLVEDLERETECSDPQMKFLKPCVKQLVLQVKEFDTAEFFLPRSIIQLDGQHCQQGVGVKGTGEDKTWGGAKGLDMESPRATEGALDMYVRTWQCKAGRVVSHD